MIVREDKNFETHSKYPNENFYPNETGVLIVDETTDGGKILAEEIKQHYPYFDFGDIEGDHLLSIEPFSPIQASTDKKEIVADGIDTATITATVDDPTSTEDIQFYDGKNNLLQTVQAVDGVAELPITATETGDITIKAVSTTKYGSGEVTIKAVSA